MPTTYGRHQRHSCCLVMSCQFFLQLILHLKPFTFHILATLASSRLKRYAKLKISQLFSLRCPEIKYGSCFAHQSCQDWTLGIHFLKRDESSRDPKTYTITWIHAGFLYSYKVNHATETHIDTHTHTRSWCTQNSIYPHTIIIICDLSRLLNANSVYRAAKYFE